MIISHYYPSVLNLEKGKITNSITEYNYNIQTSISRQLSKLNGRAMRRFDNYSDYISKRLLVENWLYYEFKNKGGIPNTRHPFYFIIGENDDLKNDFGTDAGIIQLDTDGISKLHISFTIGDSMSVFYLDSKHRKIYTLDEIGKIINEPKTIDNFFSIIPQKHHYIEVQLWDKKYFYIHDNK